MFDFFQIIDFDNRYNLNSKNYSFFNSYLYNKVKGVEYKKEYKNSSVCYLEREKNEKNHFQKNKLNIFIFGTIYTNKLFEENSNQKPKIIYADFIFDLLNKYGDDFVKYIKGSFVIVIFDETKTEAKVISDRLNVLPLYYSFKNNLLIISSSVAMILESGFVSKDFNNQAMIQQLLFDYVLGSHTYYKDIRRVENGKIYYFRNNEKKEITYWSVEELYNETLYSKSESLELLSLQLHYNTNLYCSDSEKILVALTGGLDGRANLALLDRSIDKFKCYSYGMPRSKQVDIPGIIAQRMNINYTPVMLDDKYEKEHDECALEAIHFSNGNAPILRSNYPYAYKYLNSYSNTILTGLFGSEVMRPLHNLGIMMNDYSEKLFLSDSPKSAFEEIIKDAKRKKYLADNIIDENSNEVFEKIYTDYFEKYKKYDKILRFFFFIINEGVRKYFSQEIQIERVYVTTRFPFFDDDFVALMYKTPFAGMYNGFLGKSKFKRRKGQLLYAYIYRKYKPLLGEIELDRGYKPDDLLKPFPFNYFYLYKGVKKSKSYKNLKGNDTFNSEKWTENFINESVFKVKDNMNILGTGIKQKFEDKSYLKDLLKYSHFISLLKYFNSF
jgi:hypothetical protein